MQDPRIRYLSAAILSLAAFSGIAGALLVFLWWLPFTPKAGLLKKIHLVIPLFAMIILLAIVAYFTGGVGTGYILQMSVIILIGMWLYLDHKPGDFADVCVYCLGEGIGFDLGLMGEMALQTISSTGQDLAQVRRALRIKGLPISFRNIIPVGRILILGQISRAENQAVLLACRGYSGGGTRCPEFRHTTGDIAAGALAVLVGFFAVLCREFFILPH
ncbi:MAG: hypothetical protein ABFC24_10800 [Methanoregulaceae archaeon]